MNKKDSKPIQLACIIDDDVSYTFVLQRMLSILKISDTTISFPNGEDALDYLSMVKDYPSQLPDIIFLDINMPIMNGWQFLESFGKISPQLSKQVHIYMTSSSIDKRDTNRASSHAAVADYLIKPVTKADLMRVLEEVQSNR